MTTIDDFPFRRMATYRRREEIHGKFGGQQQGGISTPVKSPFIFLFTGDEGEAFGYTDGWDSAGSGVFYYTGEGQEGDMEFSGGNRAIRDHATNGKDLLLFNTLGKGKPVRYVGSFACANYEIRDGADKNGRPRKIIVFHLVPQGLDDGLEQAAMTPARKPSAASIDELRSQAYAAAGTGEGKAGKVATRIYRERSERVREYVLARAGGRCELCEQVAPFSRTDGSPYLEPHHIRRLSDGGPDHPAHVAALCPNCHREIHHGDSGRVKNDGLQTTINHKEGV